MEKGDNPEQQLSENTLNDLNDSMLSVPPLYFPHYTAAEKCLIIEYKFQI